jgi:hypothetical protein
MNYSMTRPLTVAAFSGLAVIALSLPILFLVHRAFGLGNPPIDGVLVLGGAVIICFALAAAIGTALGNSQASSPLAALLGLVLGGATCLLVAPIYAGMVVDGLTRDATGLVWQERGHIEEAARTIGSTHGSQTWNVMREGRLQEQLAEYQKQAQEANTPEGRAAASKKVSELASQAALIGKTKAIALIKAGVARTLAFTLLLWALVGSPIVAAWSCSKAKR